MAQPHLFWAIYHFAIALNKSSSLWVCSITDVLTSAALTVEFSTVAFSTNPFLTPVH